MTRRPGVMMTTLLGVVFLATPVAVMSVPLAYDEAVSGDLPDDAVDITLNLDIGANTITGVTGNDFATPADFDEFTFTLPAQSIVTSVSFAFVLNNDGASLPNTGFVLDGGAPTALLLAVAVSPVAMFQGQLPIAGGPFEVTSTALACGCAQGEGWLASYTWTFDVQAVVPEPGVMWLTVVALLFSMVDGRYRRRTP